MSFLNDIGKEKLALYLALLLTLTSIIYWTAYGINAYNTYHEYTDIGIFSYSMYFNLHYLNIANGLQFFVFGNHIAFDLFPVALLYYIAPSPITLLAVQAIIVSLTGLLAFFVVKELSKVFKIGAKTHVWN